MTDAPTLNNDIVRQLANILNETHLTEIEYELEGCRIRVARQSLPTQINYATATSPTTVVEVAAGAGVTDTMVVTKHNDQLATLPAHFAGAAGAVKSPMVGTVYLASSPGSTPFIAIGNQVSKGQTLFIIEAMKVMNQIKSPQDGVIKHIFMKDADPVEYGQVLVVLE